MNKLVRDVLQPINTSAIIIMGVYTMLWGAWVASPFWDVFSRAQVYHYMAEFPELIWGLIAIAVGLAMVVGVLKKCFRSLTTGAMVGFLYWLMVTIFFFLGDWQNTGGVTYLMITVYCAFIWVNLTVNKE